MKKIIAIVLLVIYIPILLYNLLFGESAVSLIPFIIIAIGLIIWAISVFKNHNSCEEVSNARQ